MNMRVAIITGASSGLGREFAIQIAERYRTIEEIWLVARRKELLQETAQAVLKAGQNARVLPMDITNQQEVQHLKSLLEKDRVVVRVLVNAAGYGMIGSFEEISLADNEGMVQLNCQALTAFTHVVLPYMGKNANILNVASSAAFLPQPEFAVYAATKSYVLSFSKALNRELKKRRIAVTAVCPGPVNTAFFDVAETYHNIKAYKKLVMAEPEAVVELALKDAYHRRAVSVYGICMKALRIVAKILP